jgi:hypothetical protein
VCSALNGTTLVNVDALKRRVDAYLGPDVPPKDCRYMFYTLANTFG